MTSITLDTKIGHSKDVLASFIDNEVVMANISTDKYYGLNPVSTQIWLLLEQPKSLVELCDVLVDRYDIDKGTCQRDVLMLVERLVDAQVLEVA